MGYGGMGMGSPSGPWGYGNGGPWGYGNGGPWGGYYGW